MFADHHGFQHGEMREQSDVLKRAGDAHDRALRRAGTIERLSLEHDAAAYPRAARR